MFRQLIWLTLGSFAIGTEGLVIVGILPELAADLSVSIAQAGRLVAAFAVAYAIASPVLATLTATSRRENVLRAAMAGFALSNLAAAMAPSYPALMAARVLMAVFAGLFMPAATAYAAAAVPPEQRGRALAFLLTGITVATVLGVPAGTLLGSSLGWRAPFIAVAALSAIALAGLYLPRPPQPRASVATLGQRLAVARQPQVLGALLVTWLLFTGAFTVFTYLTPLSHLVAGITPKEVAGVLLLFGVASACGNILGGRLADRRGAGYVIQRAIPVLALVYGGLSALAMFGTGHAWSGPVALFMIGCWGLAGWMFPAAQQLHLVQSAPQAVPVTLSLNASAMYLGIASGSLLGSLAVTAGWTSGLGWIGAGCELLALAAWHSRPAAARARRAAAQAA